MPLLFVTLKLITYHFINDMVLVFGVLCLRQSELNVRTVCCIIFVQNEILLFAPVFLFLYFPLV